MKKLFVSSTFRDMQMERDCLKKHIIPDLNIKLRDWGVKISQTDLRWGISTSQLSAEDGEQKVLNVCLDEINRSRPYMIVIIGERYGWIPSPAIIDMNAQGRGMKLEDNKISVTQLEIEYIAFTEKWDESRIFFYFRDMDYGDMPESERENYESESALAREKLDALKARIVKKFPQQIRRYSLRYEDGALRGIEDFEKLVTGDLYSLFERDLREDESIDVNERVASKLHLEAIDSLQNYVSSYDLNSGGDTTLGGDSRTQRLHTYLGGATRCGKTASVMAHYAALYAYQHKDESLWSVAENLFAPTPPPLVTKSGFTTWVESFNSENTYPLYLQLGNNKDISDEKDLLRTVIYFLRAILEANGLSLPSGENTVGILRDGLRLLAKTEHAIYLFLDDLTPGAMKLFFELEHSFEEEELPEILEHFFFYLAFSSMFNKPPVYYPFYEYSGTRNDGLGIFSVSKYFFSHAKKLGKELSPEVTRHIRGFYGDYDEKFEDAGYHSISKRQASLMANYFMNLTAEDYRSIKAAGNDMNAIESHQLSLLRRLREAFTEGNSEESCRRVALMSIEKFEENHAPHVMRTLGIIYILTGIPFTRDEAELIFSRLGAEWSDLEFVSYFDDYKDFFSYDKENDAYCLIPEVGAMLRPYFISRFLPTKEELGSAIRDLLSAVRAEDFYEEKKPKLFWAILLMPDGDFVEENLRERAEDFSDPYLYGKALGESVSQFIGVLTDEEITRVGESVARNLSSRECDGVLGGFFDGVDHSPREHDYEKRLLLLLDAIESLADPSDAPLALRILMLRANCYIGWKRDRALELLYEAEEHLRMTDTAGRVRFLSLLAPLLKAFREDSTAFGRVKSTILRHLPAMNELSLSQDSEQDRRVLGNLFTLSYYVRECGVSDCYFDPEELLKPFFTREKLSSLGLNNISTAISSLSAESEAEAEVLLEKTRMVMEILASDFPASPYATSLISKCMQRRFLFIPGLAPQSRRCSELERYFYPYQKATLAAADSSSYHFISYTVFLKNARMFHKETGITHSYDEPFWEATKMGAWTGVLTWQGELSLDLVLAVCWAYVTYLSEPGFHDMISDDASNYKSHYAEQDSESPSHRALLFRLTLFLAAVLHNPSSRIMKPKLKRLFRTLEEQYGDYMTSLADFRYKAVKEYIEGI